MIGAHRFATRSNDASKWRIVVVRSANETFRSGSDRRLSELYDDRNSLRGNINPEVGQTVLLHLSNNAEPGGSSKHRPVCVECFAVAMAYIDDLAASYTTTCISLRIDGEN